MYYLLRIILKCSLLLALYAAVLLVLAVPYLWLVTLVVLVALLGRKTYRYSSCGTARWADTADLEEAAMLDEGEGLVLGTVQADVTLRDGLRALRDRRLPARRAVRTFLTSCRRKQPRRLVRLNTAVHTAIFAPSGAGKNVSLVTPFLLASREHCVVNDIKGESAKLTAEYRARAFGHKVVMIDPWQLVTDSPTAFNVLDGIDPADPESFDQIRALAEAIVEKEPLARDPHWSQRAQAFIAGAITAVVHVCPPGRRSLQEVASIMADKALLANAIQALQRSTAHDGLLARIGSEMALSTEKELDGILSTANRSLAFLSSPAVVESTRAAAGGFDPSEFGGERGVTVYLILPAQYLRSHAALMRLWATAITRGVVKRGVENPPPVNVILDECASLGRLEVIDDMLTIGRGFGLKVTAIFQSMAQLKKILPEGQEGVLLSNTTQVFFAVNDQQTAEYVSNRLGEATILVKNWSTNTGTSRSSPGGAATSYSSGTSEGLQQHARRLLKPEEVTQLDPRVAVTLTPGCPPVATWLARWYEPDFHSHRGIGFLRAAFESLCLFCGASLLAVMVTVAVARNTFG